MSSVPNQRGEYGGRTRVGAAPEPPQPILRTGPLQPQTKSTVTNLAVMGVGVALGVFGWPRYTKNKPDGVIALGAAGSMISAGLLGLLLGRSPSPGAS